ncbi:hypothetical protein PAPHI01_0327 [Pancytospora philotis]|nr:hypothetical protein PAPHI01_0327 [Pancytospora philotis]
MEFETQCAICLLDYTNNSAHRMAALKCGHCFGYGCIKRWVEMNRKATCPACSKPCKAAQIRPIYAMRQPSAEQIEKEALIEKYMEELERTRKLQTQVNALLAELDVRRLDSAAPDTVPKASPATCSDLKYANQLHCYPLVFVPSYTLSQIGRSHTVYASYSNNNGMHVLANTSIPSRRAAAKPVFCFNARITDIKPCDELGQFLIACHGCTVSTVDLRHNISVARSIMFDLPITSLCVHPRVPRMVFVGDAEGSIRWHDDVASRYGPIKLSPTAIHSIAAGGNFIFAGSVKGVFKLEVSPLPANPVAVLLETAPDTICTHVGSDGSTVLVTSRAIDGTISLLVVQGDAEYHFYPNIKQTVRYRNAVFGSHIFLADSETNTIRVINLDTSAVRHIYEFGGEKIVDYGVCKEFFYAITEKRVYYYGEKGAEGAD